MPADSHDAVILLAHGARDPRWAEPFLRVLERVRTTAPELTFELAYLEHLDPSLDVAARRLAEEGARHIQVVPLFFGRGGHLRVDVPRLIATASASLTGVTIDLASPAGEDERVVDAIAEFCVRSARAEPG